MPQLLWVLVVVGLQPFFLIRQDLHEGMRRICQVQHVLNASPRADFVAAELPEHLLLVVIRLTAQAEPVEAEWIGCHDLRTGSLSTLLSCQATLMCGAIGATVLKKRRREPLLLSVT